MLNSWNGLKVRDFGELLETQSRHLSLFSSPQCSPQAELVTAPSHATAETSPPHPALYKQADQLHLAPDPWQMSLRGDSFSLRNCCKCLLVSKCCSASNHPFHWQTSEPNRRNRPAMQTPWNEDKSHQITGQKAPEAGGVQREKNPLPSSPGQCRAPSMQWCCSLLDTDSTSQRGEEASQDDLKLFSWPYF